MMGLRFAGRHQALQIAQNGTGLCTCLLIQLYKALSCLRAPGASGRSQTQLRAAVQHALRAISLNEFKSLPQQKHRLGAHAFHGLEFVGRFTDTLGQHHQLACGRDLGGGGILLQLQGRNRFSNFQQVRRLAVDGT